MARQARQYSDTGLYHIVFRGVNKQDLFEEEQDFQKMINILLLLKSEMSFEIYAYCLMTNHVHLLIKESKIGDITAIMKRLLTKYAMWYNIKYKRSGTLIANRYKSEPVEVDDYLLSLVRYIHQNPLKAGMVNELIEYKWSSYAEYMNQEKNEITDKQFIFDMLSKDDFVEFHQVDESEVFLVTGKITKTDAAIRREIMKLIEMEPKLIGTLAKGERNRIILILKNNYSTRQIERITGISRGVIDYAVKKGTSP